MLIEGDPEGTTEGYEEATTTGEVDSSRRQMTLEGYEGDTRTGEVSPINNLLYAQSRNFTYPA